MKNVHLFIIMVVISFNVSSQNISFGVGELNINENKMTILNMYDVKNSNIISRSVVIYEINNNVKDLRSNLSIGEKSNKSKRYLGVGEHLIVIRVKWKNGYINAESHKFIIN